MPVPQNRSGPQADILKIDGKVLPAAVVALDGITHVLIQELDLEFAADPDKRRATPSTMALR